MKTLILNGSPRVNGDTVNLINQFVSKLYGEYKIVDAYRCNVSACIDCRYCWNNKGCAIQDEMQGIYSYIEECDNIVIASPIYFSELTGKLLDLASRLQKYYCSRHFQNIELINKQKKGAVIWVGGGDGNMNKPYDTACTLLHHMNCFDIFPPVCFHNTNYLSAVDDITCINQLISITDFFVIQN